MPPTVVVTAVALAFLSGPSAFLFLWLTYKRTGEGSLRTLAFSMLGLVFILIGNATGYVLSNVLRLWDPRVAFLIMNGGFVATVVRCCFSTRFAHESTRTDIAAWKRAVFWTFSILFFFLVLSLPLFLRGPHQVDISHGYLVSTLYGAICQLYATIIVVRYRATLPRFMTFLPGFLSTLMVLNVISVLNDVFHFGSLLGGPDFPFSPVFFFLINVFIVFACIRELLKTKEVRHSAFPPIDLDLTNRESEIIPLLIEGLSNEDIATRLFISPHTVKNHVTNIFRKAGVANRFELLKRISAGKTS